MWFSLDCLASLELVAGLLLVTIFQLVASLELITSFILVAILHPAEIF